MKRFHSEQKEDFGKLLKRFKSETWNKKDCLRKHSKKDLRKHTKNIHSKKDDLWNLQYQGAEEQGN